MDFWRLLQSYTWNNAGWVLLYVLSVLVIYQFAKKKQCSWKIIHFIVISTIILLNPLFAYVTSKSVFPTYKEYSRTSWLLFIPGIVSIAIAELTFNKKRMKWSVWIVYILILAIISSATIPKLVVCSDNVYKVNQSVLDVAKVLVKDVSEYDYSDIDREAFEEDDRPSVLVQYDADVGHAGDPMYYGIRQYTSCVVLAQTLITPEEYNDSDFELYTYGLMNYQYFICSNKDNLVSQAEQYGFELLFESDDYVLLKNTKVFSLYFVRHGQTDANVQGILAGSGTDAMLTEEGKSQARETGEALRNIKFSNAFISEMTRTRDTANCILHENVNKTPRCQKVEYLNDFYWGDLEGMTLDEVRNQYPDFTIDGYIGSSTDTSFVSPVGSWSKSYSIGRFKIAFWLMAASSENDANVLAVGHSGMLWYLQEQFSDEVAEDAVIDNASITVICYDKGTWTLRYLNLSAEEFENLEL